MKQAIEEPTLVEVEGEVEVEVEGEILSDPGTLTHLLMGVLIWGPLQGCRGIKCVPHKDL